MFRKTVLVLLSFIPLLVFSQNKSNTLSGKVTLNGYIRDSLSGELIIGATININGQGKGVTSNQYGFYSITLDSGTYTISITHVSYIQKTVEFLLNADKSFNFDLLPKSSSIAEVTVYANRRRDANVKNAEMGRIDLSTTRIKNIPAFMGEVDILKAIQLLPGVRNAGEGNAGFYVRGGGPDQNLIMLDDAVVYNTGHLFGFFSIFNSDAIKNTSLRNGGMPAQYGGRLCWVLVVALKDGTLY
jgi:hypothetical protein